MLESGSNLGIGRSRTKIILIVAAVLIVALAGLAGYFIWQYMSVKNNPQAVAEEATQRLVTQVGRLYQLPGDEKPTVAQVQDKEKLKEQDFFKTAENGDYILIYTNAKLALLYREKENKLINVGPISINESQQGAQPPAQQPPAATPAPATNNATRRP